MKESNDYSNEDVSDDDFAEHQEHQAEDVCRKRMGDAKSISDI